MFLSLDGPPPSQTQLYLEDLVHVRTLCRNIGNLFEVYGPHARSDPPRDRASWAWSNIPCYGEITDAWVMATLGHVERLSTYLTW
jgi:hypothetical protein